MKLGIILFKQHIGKHFKKHWAVQGRQKILRDSAEKILRNKKILVHKPEDLYEKRIFERQISEKNCLISSNS